MTPDNTASPAPMALNAGGWSVAAKAAAVDVAAALAVTLVDAASVEDDDIQACRSQSKSIVAENWADLKYRIRCDVVVVVVVVGVRSIKLLC